MRRRIQMTTGFKDWWSDDRMRMLLIIFIVVAVALSCLTPSFATVSNINSMALQISDLGILSLAMMLSMIVSGIDLSVVAVANFCSIIGARMIQAAGGERASASTVLTVFVVMLVLGSAIGALNGLLVGYLRIPAILVTLATMTLWQGLGTAMTGGTSLTGFPPLLTALGATSIFGIPVPVFILFIAIVIVWVTLIHTPTGFMAYLFGSNSTASLFSGINNAALNLRIYSLGGLLSAMAGIVIMMRTLSSSSSYGSSYILLCILISVLGGVSVTGGSGKTSGVILALVTLQMLSTGFNMLLVGHGNSNFFKSFAWGCLLLIVISLERVSSSISRHRRISNTTGHGEKQS